LAQGPAYGYQAAVTPQERAQGAGQGKIVWITRIKGSSEKNPDYAFVGTDKRVLFRDATHRQCRLHLSDPQSMTAECVTINFRRAGAPPIEEGIVPIVKGTVMWQIAQDAIAQQHQYTIDLDNLLEIAKSQFLHGELGD
jgi:hypothetical protein